MNGPFKIVYAGALVFALISILFFNEKGSWLMSGYNFSSKEEKANYDEKKLYKAWGYSYSFTAILLFISGLIENKVPYYFSHILNVLIITNGVILHILINTTCKKK